MERILLLEGYFPSGQEKRKAEAFLPAAFRL